MCHDVRAAILGVTAFDLHLELIMEPSRFSIALVGGLFASLTAALHTTAHAHTGGASVSFGSNPIRTYSGYIENLETVGADNNILTTPTNQDLIITDITSGLLAPNICAGQGRIVLQSAAGTEIAQFPVYLSLNKDAGGNTPTTIQSTAGIRIPKDTTVNLLWQWRDWNCSQSNYGVSYLFSGYLTQP